MRSRGIMFSYLCCFLLAALAWAQTGNPVAVSPGSAAGTVIGSGCPTFSWGAVAGARFYELAVYRIARDGVEERVLEKTISGSALSWTPALPQCLDGGAEYAWLVRAVGRDGSSEWSRPILFQVAPGPSDAELRGALALVERHLARRGSAMLDPEDNLADPGSSSAGTQRLSTRASKSEARDPSSGVAIGGANIWIDGDEVVTTATDQDTLGTLPCSPGNLPVRTELGWGCQAPTDLPLCGEGDFILCYSGPPVTIDVGSCRMGKRSCNLDGTGFDPCFGEVLPSPEVCDSQDNDCDGTTDAGAADATDWYPDADGDGWGDEISPPATACEAPDEHVADNTDCDDTQKFVYPGAPELCDSLDNDCDSVPDDACAGVCHPTEVACILDCCGLTCSGCPDTCGVTDACGDALQVLGMCADQHGCWPPWLPDATEPCQRENCPTQLVNFFGPECDDGEERPCGTDAGACEPGIQTCTGRLWGECAGSVDPVPETCNGIDDDCNGVTDESGILWYPDADADGYGETFGEPIDSCTTPPPGYVDNDLDCDDTDPDVHPAADEICGNGIDEDCDGSDDNGADVDGDGVCDNVDNCPNDDNANQLDSDDDGLGDACDNCPNDDNANQLDSDDDGWGDVCDNCPNDDNANQVDSDNDGLGDACDACPGSGGCCGDGIVDGGLGETCDDGNGDDSDACPSTCMQAYCGDGFLYQDVEECDDGNTDPLDGCSEICEIEE